MCEYFEDYEEVPETEPLDFTEDDVTWVASQIFGATVAFGAEAIELRKACRKYGLLAPTGTAVDPADAGDPGRAAGHGDTGE